MDAIDLLVHHHRELESRFAELLKKDPKDRAAPTRWLSASQGERDALRAMLLTY